MFRATDTLTDFLRLVYVPSRLELSDGAVKQIAVALTQFERWAGRPLSVYDFTEDLIRRFLADFRRSHAGATTNSRRRDLLAVWQCAFDEGYIDRPPRRAKVRRAKESPKIPEAWSPADVGRILESARAETRQVAGLPGADWFVSLLLVLYDTGERVGAALATGTHDLDLSSGQVVFRSTKTGRPRFCQLHSDTVEACRVIYDPGRRPMWPWEFTRAALHKRLVKILRRAGVAFGQARGGCWHKFRRTSGTLVEAAGGNGAAHIGNSRAVFERHYRDPRFFHSDLGKLPRPII